MPRSISVCLTALVLCFGPAVRAQEVEPAHFHHVHLNVTDPATTLTYYKKIHGATETRYRGVADALFT